MSLTRALPAKNSGNQDDPLRPIPFRQLSPGSYASRLAWLGSSCFVTASGGETYLLNLGPCLINAQPLLGSNWKELLEVKPRNEDLLVPNRQATVEWVLLEQPRLRAEVQCVSATPVDGGHDGHRRWLVACVDALGTLTVSCLEITPDKETLQLRTRSSFTVTGTDSSWTHHGPACCALTHGGPSGAASSPYIAVARYFPCNVSVYQGELLVRHVRTLEHPTSVVFGTGSTATSSHVRPEPNEHHELLYLTEGPSVTMCDLRAPGVATRRKIIGGHGTTQSSGTVSWYGCDLSGYELALVGPERCVLVVDVRRWAVLGRWWSCLKYDATTVLLGYKTLSGKDHSDPSSRLMYVNGQDNEMACGTWVSTDSDPLLRRSGEPGRQTEGVDRLNNTPMLRQIGLQRTGGRLFGFRADERWVGATLWHDNGWAGLTARGVLYTMEKPAFG
ncbi:hypothetical protein CCYA_CCYA01G0272 [Cyanidiococcus yangmingshanensis]|nr:hypothetical protein CCYA_CCYA01G0272 [Cyanidiococcus yangmingshanensis]